MKKKKVTFGKIYIILITILLYIPIILTVIYSFNESKISSVWGGLSLNWYRELWADRGLWESVRNSIVLAIGSVFFANVIGVSGAIGMKKGQRRADKAIGFASMLPIMIPEIILGMAFLALFSFAGMHFGMMTLLIAHTSFCIPYILLMVKARLEDIDPHIEEAARDLGANSWQVFWDITFPSILPAILSGSLLSFAMSFDDVVISIFVTGAETNTMAIKIYTKLKTGVTPEINALATIFLGIIIVVLTVYHLLIRRRK